MPFKVQDVGYGVTCPKYITVIYVAQNLVFRDYSKRMHAHTGTATHDYMHTLVKTTDHECELAADQGARSGKHGIHNNNNNNNNNNSKTEKGRRKKAINIRMTPEFCFCFERAGKVIYVGCRRQKRRGNQQW